MSDNVPQSGSRTIILFINSRISLMAFCRISILLGAGVVAFLYCGRSLARSSKAWFKRSRRTFSHSLFRLKLKINYDRLNQKSHISSEYNILRAISRNTSKRTLSLYRGLLVNKMLQWLHSFIVII